jgi:hypothetical protein
MLVYFQNVRSLVSKWDQVDYMAATCQPDIFIFNECALPTEIFPPNHELSQYTFLFNSLSRGVLLGIRQSITFNRLSSHESASAPLICIEIPPQPLCPNQLIIIGLYASPSAENRHFYNSILACLQSIFSAFPASPILIFGDFNPHHTHWGC